MGKVHWAGWSISLVTGAVVIALGTSRGEAASDQPAAILIFPYVSVDSAQGTDTVIQLSNTSTGPVSVYCLYEESRPWPFVFETTDFFINLTPSQPVAWRVSQGQSMFPIDGVTRSGSDGSSNQGSSVPAAAHDPFSATLECIAVDANKIPLGRNVLSGQATVETRRTSPTPSFDAAAYNAIGIPAVEGARNTAGNLILGGQSPEYEGCPDTLTLSHFFDGAVDPMTRSSSTITSLILVPCSHDLARGITPDISVRYSVFNEFEQRLRTSNRVAGRQIIPLSHIDAPGTPMQSIFSAAVMGTLTGQTQVVGVPNPSVPNPSPEAFGTGLVAVAVEVHQDLQDPTLTRTAISTVHSRGTRAEPDFMRFPDLPPPPECVGDCNYDSSVSVDEIITGVSIALGNSPLTVCQQLTWPWNPFDPDNNGRVTIDEILRAVNNALEGCPEH